MITVRHIQTLGLILLALLVSACGFTLRGTADLPPQLQTLVLESDDGNSDMARLMRRTLQGNGVEVLDTGDVDVYRLGIGTEESSERILSLNANARAGEYELSMSIPFQLQMAGEAIVGPEILTIEKVYLADPDNAVAKNEEADLIRTEMRRELVIQILRRLQTAPL